MELQTDAESGAPGAAGPLHPGPAGSGRHTLGCDPDAAGQHVPRLRRQAPSAGEPDPEPLSRPVWWLAAQQRASELESDEEGRRIVALLISHVETAWPWIEELEALCRGRHGRMEGDDPQAHLLRFVESDVTDLFRSLAEDAANMVPGRTGWEQEPDPDGLQGEADRFNRYLGVLVLAAEAAVIPEDVRTVVRRIGRDLGDWYPEFTVLAGAAARSPLFGRADHASQ
jgi:hypothetical protein